MGLSDHSILCILCGGQTVYFFFFFFNDTATTEIYTLSLHDALPILSASTANQPQPRRCASQRGQSALERSEEHTSELQSQSNLVCRLLLEKKKKHPDIRPTSWLRRFMSTASIAY